MRHCAALGGLRPLSVLGFLAIAMGGKEELLLGDVPEYPDMSRHLLKQMERLPLQASCGTSSPLSSSCLTVVSRLSGAVFRPHPRKRNAHHKSVP
jgi:hypothetical protein